MHAPPPCNIIHSSCANSQLAAEVAEETRVNSLNAIKILANHLSAIDPTCHRHKKISSMSFSDNQEIGENFNGIQELTQETKEGRKDHPYPSDHPSISAVLYSTVGVVYTRACWHHRAHPLCWVSAAYNPSTYISIYPIESASCDVLYAFPAAVVGVVL